MHCIFAPKRRAAALFSSAFLLAPAPAAFGQAAVDLRTWSQKGPAGNGNWNVAADGSNVLQTINGEPTFFVSPEDFFNTTVDGSFGVETGTDDDYIGFVFGFQSPQGTGTDFDFLLFDWKQGNQSGSTAGFTLSYVNGNNNIPFGNHQTSNAAAGYNVLATDVGTGRGWADNTVYDFSLIYREDRITIGIDGGPFSNETIFDVGVNDVDPSGTLFGGAFPTGQFGFYNYSQQSVRYQSFTQAADPVLVTTPGDGQTLNFANARVGGNSTNGDIIVTNAGGVGSNLTGTAGAGTGSFGGAGGPFNLGEGENATFAYTFTPTARGLATADVLFDGDDPAGDSTVTLSGTGVGPVTQTAGDTGGVFDFGTVASNETGTLVLDVDNITTDIDSIDLIGLTLDFVITGPDAALFSLLLTPGTTLDGGEGDSFDLIFDPAGMEGTFTATLTLLTDQGAAFGDTANGDSFSYTLVANAVIPEPASLAFFGLGGLLLLRRRN